MTLKLTLLALSTTALEIFLLAHALGRSLRLLPLVRLHGLCYRLLVCTLGLRPLLAAARASARPSYLEGKPAA